MEITHYALIEIGREKGASPVQNKGIPEENMKKLLIEALPLGDPENEVFKLVVIENKLYLSYLLLKDAEDIGKALIIEIDDKLLKYNPIGFTLGLKKILLPLIENSESLLAEKLDIEYSTKAVNKMEIENFDNFVFSILTQQKTIAVGEKDKLFEFLINFYQLIPDELKSHITLIANTTNLTNKVALHALILNENLLKIIDSKKGEYTILFLPTNTAYGTFTSPFCKRIATLFEEQKEESIKAEITSFYKLATESDEIIPTADFAAKYNLALADASLLQWMRSNHFNLEVQKSLLEQLE